MEGKAMTETTEQTDERRALAISKALGDYPDVGVLSRHIRVSRAIRESDEAAGLIVVQKDGNHYREGWIAGRDAAIAEIEDHDFTHSLLPILVRGLDPPE
jgi:hypothetical protein